MVLRPSTARLTRLAIVALALTAAAACGGEPSDSETIGVATAAARRADSPASERAREAPTISPRRSVRHSRRHRPGIVGKFLRSSVGLDDLTAEQRRQIRQVRLELMPTDHERNAERALVQALADGVRTGAIDADQVLVRSRELAPVKRAQRRRQAQALSSLHRILSTDQRARVVSQLVVHPRRGAEAAARGEPPSAAAPRSLPGELERWETLAELLGQLELSAEQLAQMARSRDGVTLDLPNRVEREDWRRQRLAARAALLEAFRSTELDPTSFFRGPFEQHRTRRLENELSLLEALVPILTEPQRAALARLLLDRSPHPQR
ncbi:MAG: hypothetical protein JRI23_13300 [Deltaproteobacteria bacterium]|jgi:hypothetical protein|nr:hypothetical protein [Deltaproteobacteria bacterium]MBW2532700.1 hypothetical protein [Deltaproteobacteria bacterium]